MEQKLLIKNILSAAEQGHKKALKDYISRRVVNVVDEEGSTPLIYAAANGREDIVRLLLDEEVCGGCGQSHNVVICNCSLMYKSIPHTYTSTHLTHTHMNLPKHTHIHTHKCTQTHTHTHTHQRMQTHTHSV